MKALGLIGALAGIAVSWLIGCQGSSQHEVSRRSLSTRLVGVGRPKGAVFVGIDSLLVLTEDSGATLRQVNVASGSTEATFALNKIDEGAALAGENGHFRAVWIDAARTPETIFMAPRQNLWVKKRA